MLEEQRQKRIYFTFYLIHPKSIIAPIDRWHKFKTLIYIQDCNLIRWQQLNLLKSISLVSNRKSWGPQNNQMPHTELFISNEHCRKLRLNWVLNMEGKRWASRADSEAREISCTSSTCAPSKCESWKGELQHVLKSLCNVNHWNRFRCAPTGGIK